MSLFSCAYTIYRVKGNFFINIPLREEETMGDDETVDDSCRHEQQRTGREAKEVGVFARNTTVYKLPTIGISTAYV